MPCLKLSSRVRGEPRASLSVLQGSLLSHCNLRSQGALSLPQASSFFKFTQGLARSQSTAVHIEQGQL